MKNMGNENRKFARGRKPAEKGTCLCLNCNKRVPVEKTIKVRLVGSSSFVRVCKS